MCMWMDGCVCVCVCVCVVLMSLITVLPNRDWLREAHEFCQCQFEIFLVGTKYDSLVRELQPFFPFIVIFCVYVCLCVCVCVRACV